MAVSVCEGNFNSQEASLPVRLDTGSTSSSSVEDYQYLECEFQFCTITSTTSTSTEFVDQPDQVV